MTEQPEEHPENVIQAQIVMHAEIEVTRAADLDPEIDDIRSTK